MSSNNDNGFGALVQDETYEENEKNKETKTDQTNETPQEKVDRELQKILADRRSRNSNMCNGGYHGMCTFDRNTCACVCHLATRKIPVG
jgi:hypothetical protein